MVRREDEPPLGLGQRDSGLIESEKLSFSELAAFIGRPTLGELRTWQNAPPADWVRESKAARARIYKIGDGKLGYQYAFR